jgi:hypothetical protein
MACNHIKKDASELPVYQDVKGDVARVFSNVWNHKLEPWGTFIAKQDIGLIFITNNTDGHFYEINDTKKWLFTKLKYGI